MTNKTNEIAYIHCSITVQANTSYMIPQKSSYVGNVMNSDPLPCLYRTDELKRTGKWLITIDVKNWRIINWPNIPCAKVTIYPVGLSEFTFVNEDKDIIFIYREDLDDTCIRPIIMKRYMNMTIDSNGEIVRSDDFNYKTFFKVANVINEETEIYIENECTKVLKKFAENAYLQVQSFVGRVSVNTCKKMIRAIVGIYEFSEKDDCIAYFNRPETMELFVNEAIKNEHHLAETMNRMWD